MVSKDPNYNENEKQHTVYICVLAHLKMFPLTIYCNKSFVSIHFSRNRI